MQVTPMERNALYYGDCLNVMQIWPDESMDLVYLDPPFNSNADYNVLWESSNCKKTGTFAFAHAWTWDAPARERASVIG